MIVLLSAAMSIFSIIVDINLASAMSMRSGSAEATLIELVHVVQRVPVCAPDVAIVATHIPALEIDVFSQPAGKHELSPMLVVVVSRHKWSVFDRVCICWLRKNTEKTRAQ